MTASQKKQRPIGIIHLIAGYVADMCYITQLTGEEEKPSNKLFNTKRMITHDTENTFLKHAVEDHHIASLLHTAEGTKRTKTVIYLCFGSDSANKDNPLLSSQRSLKPATLSRQNAAVILLYRVVAEKILWVRSLSNMSCTFPGAELTN